MFSRKKKLVFISLTLVTSLWLSYFYFYPHGFRTFRMKQIHDILFDVYFPTDSNFTIVQEMKRALYRNLMWIKMKGNAQIEQILEPLLEFRASIPKTLRDDFKDVFQEGVTRVAPHRVEEFRLALMRTAPIEVQKQLLLAKQAWLYLIYSIPLADEIADTSSSPEPTGKNLPLNLPESRLVLKQNEITHRDGEIDYLIVGSGPAGSVIAHELARLKSARVVLIDAGSFVKPLCMNTQSNSDLMESRNLRRTASGGVVLRNGHAVGGGTTVNIDLAFSPLLPQIQKRLQAWVDAGSLPADFFHDRAGDFNKLKDAYQWVRDKVHTRHVDLAEVNANNGLLLKGAPLARTYDLNARPASSKDEILKISAVEALLMPALRRQEDFKGHLSLISDARILRVEIEEGAEAKRAKAVRLIFSEPYDHKCVVKDLNNLRADRNKEYSLKAKNIILSAGSLGSADVLLRSNLSSDYIGRGVVLHPSMGAIGTFDRKINALEGLSASVYAPAPDASYFFEAMSARPSYVAAIHPGNGHDVLETIRHFNQLGGFGVMLVDSVSPENRVVINAQTNEPEVLYAFSEQDKVTMKRGLSEAIKILLRQGAQGVILPTSEQVFEGGRYAPIRSEREADAIVQKLTLADGFNFVSSAHMQGTNKLSKDAASGVVSPRFRVWDTKRSLEIPNFYVCDGSVFPTSVGANPMQSIYTIAKLFVDQVLMKEQVESTR